MRMVKGVEEEKGKVMMVGVEEEGGEVVHKRGVFDKMGKKDFVERGEEIFEVR